MDFNEKGFLGIAITEFTVSIESRYKEFFQACSSVNELAQAVKFDLQVHSQDGQEVLAATLLIRVLNGFQGVVLMMRYGLSYEAKILLRGIVETLFILKLTCDQQDFFMEYFGSDQVQRLKWMNIARQSKDPHFDSLRQYATDARVQELTDEIARGGHKKLEPEPIARRAGLQTMYDTDYRILCEEVHTLPRAIQHVWTSDENSDPVQFNWGPSDESIKYVLFTAIRVLFIALVSATKLFEVDKTEELTKVDQTLTRLNLMVEA